MDQMELLKAMQEMMADMKAGQAKAEAERKDDRKADQKMMEENQAKAEAERKADQKRTEENQAKAEANLADMKESLKEAMRVAVSAIEGKMEAAVNTVRSELDGKIEKTQTELRAVEASLDVRARKREASLKDMKTDFITNLTMVSLGTRPIRREVTAQKCGKEETIETNKREFQAPLEAVKAGAERGRGIGGGASKVQPPKFDGTASWAVFRRQFEIAAERNGWTDLEKYTHLITALQGRAADVLHGIRRALRTRKFFRPWRTASGTDISPPHIAVS
jgi:hypothetical protein